MRTLRLRELGLTLLVSLLILPAAAQEGSWQGPEKGSQLKAELVDKDKNAARRIVLIEVDVKNVTLTDPTSYRGGGSGIGHLQYRIDGGAYILPMSNRLVFEGLTPGKHSIEVSLADNSYRPMGAKVDLEVVIP